MTGWTAMAGMSYYLVPDEETARALAEAFAEFGYPRVTARPTRQDLSEFDAVERTSWTVYVFDDGPYPTDRAGRRAYREVDRRATALAREHGGFPRGGSQFDVSKVGVVDQDGPIMLVNPGRRPELPEIVDVPEPADAVLALTPDEIEDVKIDLADLDAVDWAALEHAYGSAEDTPELIRSLACDFEVWEGWWEIYRELFCDNLMHQGTFYSATAAAIPFVARIATSGALPALCRAYLYRELVLAAGEWEQSMVGRMSLGYGPSPAAWTEDAYRAVGVVVPSVLERWDFEPFANRYLLAFLAALYSRTEFTDKVSAMADQISDTKPGHYLRLAVALLRDADEQMAELSADIADWEDYDAAYVDVPSVGVAMKGRITLTKGVLTTAFGESS